MPRGCFGWRCMRLLGNLTGVFSSPFWARAATAVGQFRAIIWVQPSISRSALWAAQTDYVMLADPLSSYVSGATIAVTGGKPCI